MTIKPVHKPTSIDIAFHAGVSQSTVSRALSGSPLVSEETREKVLAVAKELNYKVDKSASNLRSKSTKTIALLLFEDKTSDDSNINPFFLSMLGSITRATASRGYDLLVSFQQLSDNWFSDYEEAHRADGMILLGYGDYLSIKDNLAILQEAGAHFILWGPVEKEQSGASIGCDNFWGGYIATRHLIEKGCKRIAFLGSATESEPEFLERYQGFQKALSEAELIESGQADSDSTEVGGLNAAEQVLASGAELDGIFCASDLIAIGAIRALTSKGLNVPQNVRVVGFDDIATAAYMSPSLTTVRQSTSEAGEKLVNNLLKIISGEQVQSELMKPMLIVRESCGD